MSGQKRTAVGLGFAIVAVAIVSAVPGTKAGAQNAASNARSYVCMVREGRNDTEQPTRIVAPQSTVRVMVAKGFSEFDCEREGFSESSQLAFRSEVCRMAAEYPEGMQKQFEQILGERPAVLCGMAEVVLGPWDAQEAQR